MKSKNLHVVQKGAPDMTGATRTARAWRAWWPALLWAALIFVLSSIPGTRFPTVDAPHADKVVHVALYLVLGVLCLRGVRARAGMTGARAVAAAALIATLYGISDELHQIFTPNQSADWHDAAADAAGGLMGAFVAWALHAARRNTKSSAQKGPRTSSNPPAQPR